MNSHITADFRACFSGLSQTIQKDAQQAFHHFQQDPHYPGLQFKSVFGTLSGKTRKLWSVRVGLHYRALGEMRDGEIYWLWIGSHAEYDKITSPAKH
jgi:hypothetical protein